jgi:outer membrane protein assembly factor BamB
LAVVDVNNQLLAFDLQGKQKWKVNLGAEVISPPVGAGRHIVVRSLDYTVLNYATDNGALRWRFARPLPPLTLRIHSGVDVVANRVFAGFPGGRVVGLDLATGGLVWEGVLANPTGTTEVERIADITGQPFYNLREICAATFQGRIGCLDGVNGRVVWSQAFSAPLGASVDERYVVAQNELGDVFAFSRANGQEVWRVPYFQRRGAQTPVAMGRSVVVTDVQGYVHFVDRDTGRTLARTRLGSVGMASRPVVLDGGELLVQSRKGDLALLVIQ